MSEMLVKTHDTPAVRRTSFVRDEVFEAYWVRPATPAEIKVAHPKCATCKHWIFDTPADEPQGSWDYCDISIETDEIDPHTAYCMHHTPKELE